MKASKIEIVTYAVGGLTLLGGLIAWALDRARKHEGAAKIAPPMFIFGTGLLVTGGALSIQRRVRGHSRVGVKSLGESVSLGIQETGQKHTPAGRTRMYYDKKMDVPERVYLLQGLVADAAKNAEMRKLALGITGHGKTIVQFGTNKFEVTGAGCPARDDLCELKAIFDFVANPRVVRYTGDIGPHVVAPGEDPEAIDLFQSAMKTLEFKGGDCDDGSGVAVSLAVLNGFAGKLRITSNTGETWDHIYAMAGVPKLDPSKYIALDVTLGPGKFGLEPARAKFVDYAA